MLSVRGFPSVVCFLSPVVEARDLAAMDFSGKITVSFWMSGSRLDKAFTFLFRVERSVRATGVQRSDHEDGGQEEDAEPRLAPAISIVGVELKVKEMNWKWLKLGSAAGGALDVFELITK